VGGVDVKHVNSGSDAGVVQIQGSGLSKPLLRERLAYAHLRVVLSKSDLELVRFYS